MAACISPLSLKRGEERVVVPCGKCGNCLQRKRADWTFRLKQEMKDCFSACFLTLTYADDKVPKCVDCTLTVCKEHVQLFMKRLRKAQEKAQGDPLRYYFVGEYGSRTERPHYHAIMFNLSPLVLPQVESVWGLGQVHAGSCTPASIHYVTKFHLNKHSDWEEQEKRERPFLLCHVDPAGLA